MKKTKKIGILTVHKTLNYGGTLQAYSLFKHLSKFGDVEVLDYQNSYIEQSFYPVRFSPSIKGLAKAIIDILRFRSRSRVIKKFKDFNKTNVFYSKRFNLKSKMQLPHAYDLVLSGSDQIWNPICTSGKNEFDTTYFLDFIEKSIPKVSYASSMGSFKPSIEQKKQLRSLLATYRMISVREQDTKKFLQNELDREIYNVCDPTLLHNASEWIEQFSLKKILKRM